MTPPLLTVDRVLTTGQVRGRGMVDPRMLTHLDEIETDLLACRDQIQVDGWIGELEGIDLTLAFLRGRREEANRLQHRERVALFALSLYFLFITWETPDEVGGVMMPLTMAFAVLPIYIDAITFRRALSAASTPGTRPRTVTRCDRTPGPPSTGMPSSSR